MIDFLTFKDIVSVLLSLVMGTIAILSYLQARKTLFSPIKTEIFKLQVELFREIMTFFQNKTEYDLLKSFDSAGLIYYNSLGMLSIYSLRYLGNSLQYAKQIEEAKAKDIAYIRYSQKAAEKYLRPIEHQRPKKNDKDLGASQTQKMTLTEWNKTEHDMLIVTAKHDLCRKTIERFLSSPLLPQKLRDEIKIFEDYLEENLILLASVFSECYKELPHKLASLQQLEDFSDAWIHNRFNRKRREFEPQAKKILTALNDYLMVEELLKK